ncbi:hypothetical protein A2U01_0053537, partial [Trifolium medium]|nr:hypothetical protein [Trifolium medium]
MGERIDVLETELEGVKSSLKELTLQMRHQNAVQQQQTTVLDALSKKLG